MDDRKDSPFGYIIPRTLSESIYIYLKDAIIKNKLKANQRIIDKEIAGLFNVSTTPVREAVLRLSAEGFVTIDSHREAVVKAISYDELKDIFQVMSILDSSAAVMVLDHLSREDIKDLEDLVKEMERNYNKNSLEKYLALNNAMHLMLWERLSNKILRSTLQKINNQMLRYNNARVIVFHKKEVLEKSMNDHREILNAIKAKDKNKLKNLMLKHWEKPNLLSPFEKGIKEYLNKKGGEE